MRSTTRSHQLRLSSLPPVCWNSWCRSPPSWCWSEQPSGSWGGGAHSWPSSSPRTWVRGSECCSRRQGSWRAKSGRSASRRRSSSTRSRRSPERFSPRAPSRGRCGVVAYACWDSPLSSSCFSTQVSRPTCSGSSPRLPVYFLGCCWPARNRPCAGLAAPTTRHAAFCHSRL